MKQIFVTLQHICGHCLSALLFIHIFSVSVCARAAVYPDLVQRDGDIDVFTEYTSLFSPVVCDHLLVCIPHTPWYALQNGVPIFWDLCVYDHPSTEKHTKQRKKFSFSHIISYKNCFAHQGIACHDGYIVCTTDRKLTQIRAQFIKKRETVQDGSYGMHLGGCCCVGNECIVATSNYPNRPASSALAVYDMENGMFLGEYVFDSCADTGYTGGISYDNNYFWLCFDNTNRLWKMKRTERCAFSLVQEYILPIDIEGKHGWQGMAWLDHYLFLNVHEHEKNSGMDVFLFEDNDFSFVQHIETLTWDAVGWDGEAMGSQDIAIVQSAAGDFLYLASRGERHGNNDYACFRISSYTISDTTHAL